MSKSKRKQHRSNHDLQPKVNDKINTSDLSGAPALEVDLPQDHIKLDLNDQNENSLASVKQEESAREEPKILQSDLDNTIDDNNDFNEISKEQSMEEVDQDDIKIQLQEPEIEQIEKPKVNPVEIHFAVNSRPSAEIGINETTLDLLSRGYGPK